jgi:hypothetical protein
MLTRRLPLPTWLLVLVAAVALAAAAAVALPRAEAQEPTEIVFVDNLGVDPNVSGVVDLFIPPNGADAMFAQCGGAYPSSGPQAPFQITTRQPTPFLIRLTIRNSTAGVVSAPVRVNCTFDFLFPAPASEGAVRQAVRQAVA